MLRLSQLFEQEENSFDAADSNMALNVSQLSHPPSPVPQSPQSVVSSNSPSPVPSLFSTKTHNRFPSSGSSLASSPGVGASSEPFGTMKTPLTDVKEEPVEHDTIRVKGCHYFRMFLFNHLSTPPFLLHVLLTAYCYSAFQSSSYR